MLGEQIQQVANIPAVDNGGQVVGLLQHIQAAVEGLTQRFGRLEEEVRVLEARAAASEANRFAATENSVAMQADQRIRSLRSVATNEPIAGFPPTLGDIATLSDAAAQHILAELGMPTDGSLADKRRRVRVAAGVTLAVP